MPRIRWSTERAHEVSCDLLAVPVFKGGGGVPREVAAALGADPAELLEQAELKAELGDALALPLPPAARAKRVLLVGMGEKAKADPGVARKAGAVVARRAGRATSVASTIAASVRGPAPVAAGAFAEGFLLGSYRFERYKSNGSGRAVPDLALVGGAARDARAVGRAIERAEILAGATNLARDLTNTPAGDLSPEALATEAGRLAKSCGLQIEVLTEKELREGGFGGILGVGQGSGRPPRMVVLRYRPAGARRRVALVGKGITFDSGGINLKTQQLDWMKMDMGGAAAVLGALQAVSRLKAKVAVTGVLCSAENMPGGNALHPGDVIRIRGGKTVEVGDTDAEGRLVLADGLSYAVEKGADVIADAATLTGACMTALGRRAFGVMGSSHVEVKRVLDAAGRAGEIAWELPLFPSYRKLLDSDVADLINISRRDFGGGAITAGLFLKEFTGDVPWVHLDIAGAAKSDSEEFEVPKGASGASVRTLVEWILAMAPARAS
ncbi:MAG: leucyl aminopeptidase [Acidobacteria bacterium]|nr:leucyl aminopeptidase [Acidobacteriota bacterium]